MSTETTVVSPRRIEPRALLAWTTVAVLAAVAILGAAAVPLSPLIVSVGLAGAALTAIAIGLVYRMSNRAVWKLVLLVMVLAIFGPLLDLLTHQPVVWLLGITIVLVFLVRQFKYPGILADTRPGHMSMIAFLLLGYL